MSVSWTRLSYSIKSVSAIRWSRSLSRQPTVTSGADRLLRAGQEMGEVTKQLEVSEGDLTNHTWRAQ